jgi:hypothetical protein
MKTFKIIFTFVALLFTFAACTDKFDISEVNTGEHTQNILVILYMFNKILFGVVLTNLKI